MQSQAWRILLVEDDEEDYILTRQMLKEAHGSTDQIRWVTNTAAALSALEQDLPDVALVDYHLGTENGLDLIRQVTARGYNLPCILLTGRGSYSLDLEAMQAGVMDYLAKSEANPTLLERVIRYALERHRLREEIVHQKELLETVLKVDPSAIALFTGPELRASYANAAFRAFLPQPVDEPLGYPIQRIFDESIYLPDGRLVESLDLAEYEIPGANNQPRHFICHLRGLKWQGWPAVLLIAWETTELEEARRMVEQAALNALHQAEELKQVLGQLETEQARLNAIFANAPSGIVLADALACIQYANPVAEQIIRKPVQVGQPYHQNSSLGFMRDNGQPYPPKDFPLTRSVLHGEVHNNVPMHVTWPDGQRRAVLFNSTPIYDAQQHITGAVAVFSDITEHQKAAEEIRRNLAQIEVQHHLMQSREKERLRIAQDLHDGPLQGLIALTFQLRDIRNGLEDNALNERLGLSENLLQEQIRELRAFSQQLRPPVLTPFGLEKAIRSHVEKFQEAHPDIHIGLALQPDRRALSEETRLALFRIYQELMNNIVRHARANEIEVRLALDPEQVELVISDDGLGFEVPDTWVEMARQGHLGLVGVQERASAVNGYVDFFSTPGKGTSVRVTVPLQNTGASTPVPGD